MRKIHKEVILDFDYTLFDTAKFKKALANSLYSLGVGSKLFLKFYHQAVHKHNGQYCYSTKIHIKLLKNILPQLSFKEAEKKLNSVVKNSKIFLYPQTNDFLSQLKKNNFRLILVTRGDKYFQGRKLRYSGIKKFFYRIIISPDIKISSIVDLVKNFDEVFFVSDYADELKQIKDSFPQLLPIMKLGGHGNKKTAQGLRVPYFRDLKNIKKFIIEYYKQNNKIGD